jgi:hypothetical protein
VQPTEIQVQRCLQVLERSDADGLPAPDSDVLADEVPLGLVELLADAPAIRLERMADARMRMVAGDQPTDDDLAARLVGRMVCDRIR